MITHLPDPLRIVLSCLKGFSAMAHPSPYSGVSWIAPEEPLEVQWICGICEGVEETTPGYDAPSPPVCNTCARLCLLDALSALGVSL